MLKRFAPYFTNIAAIAAYVICFMLIVASMAVNYVEQPPMTAELNHLNATILAKPEFRGDSGVGVVLVEFEKMPIRGPQKTLILVAKSADVKPGEIVAVENVTFSPGGPGDPVECMIVVPKEGGRRR